MECLRFLFGAVVLLCVTLALAGCGRLESDVLTPRLGEGSSGGTPTTTISGNGGELFDGEGGGAPACCVVSEISPFEGPSWFQFGEPGTLGPCPDPTIEGLTGYQEMKVEPHACGACSCSPAACTFPEGMHTNAAKCADADGSIAVPFGPTAGSSGTCSDAGALPAGFTCGGAPCVHSISISAVGVAPCEVEIGPAATPPDPTWGRMARECVIEPLSGEGCPAAHVCVPEVPGGLSLCLHAEGEQPVCPAAYPARTVFYTSVTDERGCEACACSSPPAGAQCAAILSTFSDSACSALVAAVLVSTQEPTCTDVITGTALGSTEAIMVVDVSGSCDPGGGAPFGDVQPAGPLTLCCQGDPAPPG